MHEAAKVLEASPGSYPSYGNGKQVAPLVQYSDEVWEVKAPVQSEVWEPPVALHRVVYDGGVCGAGTCCEAVPGVRAVFVGQVDRLALNPLGKAC